MADYPDFTYRGDVDIIAQSIGNVAVDIVAQTLTTLGINITAQDLAELIIKINAQAVGIYLQPEWAAKTGIDKNFACENDNAAWAEVAYVSYSVPAGKTLFLSGLSFQTQVLTNTDYDHFLYVQIAVTVAGTTIVTFAGLGGGSLTFPKPIVADATEEVILLVVNRANLSCKISATMWGYEI